MSFVMVETGIVACSLAMDALAVSCAMGGSSGKRGRFVLALSLGIICGSFQFIMPFLGWLLGGTGVVYVATWDHWIAFGLLSFVGLRMILESQKESKTWEVEVPFFFMVFLGFVTAIDAFAVGASEAFLRKPILPLASLSGMAAAFFAFCGTFLGGKLSCLATPWMEKAAGFVLILLGVHILWSHLF